MTAVRTRHLRPEDLAGLRWRGYIRESTQAQADRGTPVERQRQDIARAAEGLGMLGDGRWYERVGSGETASAPELAQALADAGQYDVLVCFALSRFARDRAEAVTQKKAFRAAGVIIYFVAERLISGTYTGALAEGVGEVLDERANEERRFYIAGGHRQRQLAGRWLGIVPFGYRKVMVDRLDGSRGWDGALEPDPVQAPVVRSVYDAVAAGKGSTEIANELNGAGVRGPSGLRWSRRAVDRILTNVVYAGQLVRYRTRLPRHYYDHDGAEGRVDLGERFPPIVSEAMYDQVRATRIARGRCAGAKPRGAQLVYPLSGVLRCTRCGRKMTGSHNTANVRYYRCHGGRDQGTCDARSIRADVAERAFADWLGSHRLPDDWRLAIARAPVVDFRADERDRQTVLAGQLARLKDLYQFGDIAREEYLAKSAAIKSDMVVVAKPAIASMEAVADVLADLGSAWSSVDPATQAAIPPLMLKAAEVEEGRIATWVVDAGLRPLLELCVPMAGRVYLPSAEASVRYAG